MVEPNDPQITLQRCREKLAEGASVHFYPEGTRSPDGFVQRFHRGAFELAVELNQEILPIILCDTNTVDAARRLLVRAISCRPSAHAARHAAKF